MTLISVLIGIALDRLLTQLQEYRKYRGFLHYVDWIRYRFNGPMLDHFGGVMLVLLPVWGLIWSLQVWTDEWLFGLVKLVFSTAVFIYCLGPRDLAMDVDTWCEVCDSLHPALRLRAAAQLLGVSDELPENVEDNTRSVTSGVLVQANERLFGVLFWFVLLGPLGAVMWRSSSLLQRHYRFDGEFGLAAGWLFGLLIWLPARLLALAYALSGHFDAALEGWKAAHHRSPVGSEGSEIVLAETGMGALGLAEDSFVRTCREPVQAAMRLVWRSLVICIVVIALMTLVGWTS
jgi:membrane protein required for beta-lactamase induction